MKSFEIEIINWEWQTTKTLGDNFYFLSNEHPRLKHFCSKEEACNWLRAQGFAPRTRLDPDVFVSSQRGFQAHIREID